MAKWRILSGLAFLLAGCAQHEPAPHGARARTFNPDWSVPLDVDGTHLFVPVIWNAGTPRDPRPWPNGVLVQSGGWGQFNPRLGPISAADRLRSGEMFRAESAGQRRPEMGAGPFFYLNMTFEYPETPVQYTSRGRPRGQTATGWDTLAIRYHVPTDKFTYTYDSLFERLRLQDGADIGSGWREVKLPYLNGQIRVRFDAADWHAVGGRSPRHLAVESVSVMHSRWYPTNSDAYWDHFMPYARQGWSVTFGSGHLPVSQWRAKYETAQSLFDWLRTPPEQRPAQQRFLWWPDIRYRSVKGWRLAD